MIGVKIKAYWEKLDILIHLLDLKNMVGTVYAEKGKSTEFHYDFSCIIAGSISTVQFNRLSEFGDSEFQKWKYCGKQSTEICKTSCASQRY